MRKVLHGAGVLLALSLAASVRAQAPDAQTYFDFQVDRPVKAKSARTPDYPSRLRDSHVDGQVLAQFVVDENGSPVMSSFQVIKSTDAELTESVRRAVSQSTFFPAEAHGQKVKCLVQEPFTFASRR